MALSVIKLQKIEDGATLNIPLGEEEKWMVVCPNPAVADALRANIQGRHPQKTIETTTVAKFLSDLFREHFPEKKVLRKADLIPKFATIWKLKFDNVDPSYFHQAFELLTDLRSFTLNKDLIEDILSFYPEIVAQAVRYFWLIMEDQAYVDEHQAYSDILTILRGQMTEGPIDEGRDLSEKGYVFQGFTHLSANQIELLKVLSQISTVQVPIPKTVLEESLSTDWVDWIKTQADHVTLWGEPENESKVSVIRFTKGTGNEVLEDVLRENLGHIIFPKGQVSVKSMWGIPSRDVFFKGQTNLFRTFIYELRLELEKRFFKDQFVRCQSDEIFSFLKEWKQELIDKKNKAFKDFVELRYLDCFIEVFNQWVELSEVNEEVSHFDLDLILEVTSLNLPRNFTLPLGKNFSFRTYTLKELFQVNKDEPNYVLATEDHDLSIGGAPDYSKDVQDILITLGPMRRKALDFTFYIHHLKEILGHNKTTLLLEKGLEKHDLAWHKVLEGSEEKEQDYRPGQRVLDKTFDETLDLKTYEPIENISASRLQTYLDCPRKYYYSYVLDWGNEPERLRTIDPRHLGTAEHNVVQAYLDKFTEFDKEELDKIILQEISKTFPSHLLEEETIREEIYSEVMFYSEQNILEFLKLKKLDDSVVFKFEEPVSAPHSVGKADVVIKSHKLGTMVLDLKRSGGSIPSGSDLLNMNSIQIWYYLNYLDINPQEVSLFGYVNLSDPAESLLYGLDQDVSDKLLEVGFLNQSKFTSLKDDFSTYLEKLVGIHEEARKGIITQPSFDIIPMSKDVCSYCPGSNICSRGL